MSDLTYLSASIRSLAFEYDFLTNRVKTICETESDKLLRRESKLVNRLSDLDISEFSTEDEVREALLLSIELDGVRKRILDLRQLVGDIESPT